MDSAAMPRGSRRPPRIGPLTNIQEDSRSFTVHVTRQGRTVSDYFSFAVWGGRAPALVAAQRFRDELLARRLGPDSRVRRRVARGRGMGSRPGVTLERYSVEGRHYERYIAQWQDPDKGLERRRFSLKRHGKRRARALAIEARRSGGRECQLPSAGPPTQGSQPPTAECPPHAPSSEASVGSQGHHHGGPPPASSGMSRRIERTQSSSRLGFMSWIRESTA